MTGEITSPRAGLALAPSMRGQWAELFSFLRHPALPDGFARPAVCLRVLGRLFVLDLVFLFAFVVTLVTAEALGISFPENLNSTIELNAGTVALFVIAAPVLEEIAFRSWLSGRQGTILAVLSVAVGIGALLVSGTQGSLAGPVIALAGIVAAVLALVLLRRRPRFGWFDRHFPAFFWASAIAFALVHLTNYSEGALAILLPLLVPQFVLGVLAGYVRVNCGLAWSMALHAMHNGFAIGMALLALAFGGGG